MPMAKSAAATPMDPWLRMFIVFLFVGSGVMQPLLISTLAYESAYDRSTLIFLLPNYVGSKRAPPHCCVSIPPRARCVSIPPRAPT